MLVRHRAQLDRLDASLGDGDHGENMSVGFGDAVRAIAPGSRGAGRGRGPARPRPAARGERRRGGRLAVRHGVHRGGDRRRRPDGAGRVATSRRRSTPRRRALPAAAGAGRATRRSTTRCGRRRMRSRRPPRGRRPRRGARAAPRAAARAGMHRDAAARSRGAASRCGSASGRAATRTRARPRASSSCGRCCPTAGRDAARTGRRLGAACRRRHVTAAERRRIFEDAQRQADSVFAQYQLSQLVALGGDLGVMAASVIGELVRVSDAVAGALWLVLAAASTHALRLCADGARRARPYPDAVAVSRTGSRPWPRRTRGSRPSGWHGVTLDERREIGDDEPGSRTVGLHRAPAARGRLAAAGPDPAPRARPPRARDRVPRRPAARHARRRAGAPRRDPRRRERRDRRRGRRAPRRPGQPRRLVAPRRAPGGPAGDLPRAPGLRRRASGPARRPAPSAAAPRCRFEEVLEGPSGIVDAEMRLVRAGRHRDPGRGLVLARWPAASRARSSCSATSAPSWPPSELRASFLAAVSHELRTPLALIGGYVDSLLGLDLDPAAQRRSVERIGHAATRLNLLVDELLDLTQLEHASLGPPPDAGRRRRRSLRRSPATSASPRGCPRSTSPRRRTCRRSTPTRMRIGHVLANLVDNARKYGGDGPVTITARRSRRLVVVTVQDTGPGIAAEERDARVRPLLPRPGGARGGRAGQRPRPVRVPAAGRGARRPDLGRAGGRPERDLVQPAARAARARRRRS